MCLGILMRSFQRSKKVEVDRWCTFSGFINIAALFRYSVVGAYVYLG